MASPYHDNPTKRHSTLQSPRDEGFDERTLSTSPPPGPGRPYNFETTSTYKDHGYSGDSATLSGAPTDYNQKRYSAKQLDESQDASLMANASEMPRSDSYRDLEYADPQPLNKDTTAEKAGPLGALMAKAGLKPPSGRYPLQQRIEDKKRGIARQKYPFLVWALTIAMIGVFIKELVLNAQQQGSPLSFKPTPNYMLGPSSSALINLGARFPACMKAVTELPVTQILPCMNDTANPPDRTCPISELCGFGANEEPNQWFRFITPIFLHAGIIHILLNMLAQLSLSAQVEKEMGSGGFLITYFAGGIFGNVLGGNFSLVGIPSVGASGAIFGTLAVKWVDLFAHWKYHYRPARLLIFMTIELAIGVAIGYIPYVDNFAHLGGFLMGLLCATIFYPVISETRRHKLIMWGFRIAAIPIAIVLYVVLIRNFYTANPYAACEGCRYLSCWPTSSNNYCKGFVSLSCNHGCFANLSFCRTGLTYTTTTN
ncbi:rhomboid-domain-containing protein [Flagelloscypha sp. PMI_526]|nr:rhomboid-domain-containing protein [Flagelloscypha sp. PMI_526]